MAASTSSIQQRSPAAQLRHLLKQDDVVVAPGKPTERWKQRLKGAKLILPLPLLSPLRRRLRRDQCSDGSQGETSTIRKSIQVCSPAFLQTGHKALYVTGAGTSASYLGRADLGFLAMNDVLHVAGMAASLGASGSGQIIPVIADADTGFGVAPQVARTVTEYHRAGIAALHIEDQVASKRCGHLDSKQLVETNDFLARIAAATRARDRLPGDAKDKIIIIARTDALAVNGMQDALDRMRKAKELGADMGFVEGLTSDEQASLAAKELSSDGWPLLLNHVTGGKSPLWKVQDAERLGFRLSIFPCAGIFPAMRALEHSYSHLQQVGIGAEAAESTSQDRFANLHQPAGPGEESRPLTLRQFFVDVGLEQEMEIDADASAASKSAGALGQP